MQIYAYLADLVVAIHLAYVLTVLVGLVLILIGWLAKWRWIRHFWLRLIHLLMIAVVAFQAWIGVICPLTHLENYLRKLAGQSGYSGTFIGHLLESLLYYEAPPWVFVFAYTLVAVLILSTLILVPPNWPRRLKPSQQ
ncbi:MAG: DUF2784 domain-containing protein [Thermogutta sp.]|nr:DUF2784 domain-containing protein [Thermogutta sp.]HPU07724.1 DUF2784 domain-containing protein [Thermogutta sp.]HQF15101.1 DUF2784 domain-containing protein [Thermogutta sp.]